jgi:uncharacterized membrane protein YdjX (TVP38/TMEM64 family)
MFLLGRIKIWLYAIGAAIAAVGLAYLRGRSAGADAVKADINEDRLDAMKTAKDVEDEIRSLDDPAFVDRAGQWVRKD